VGETVFQAQQLAKDTVGELFGTARDGTADQQHEQQQEQQQQTSTASEKQAAHVRLRTFLSAALQEMRAAVLPEPPASSALRGAAAKAGDLQTAGTSELVLSSVPESAWQRKWRDMRDSLGGHPIFRVLPGGALLARGRDVAEAARERWETSDSPLVHRIQDAADALTTESEAAAALREAWARDPSFDMVRFLRHLRHDVPVVIKAYLEGREDDIRAHCSPEMIERLTGIAAAQAAAGLVPDPTLLDVAEVELVDVKALDGDPVVVVQFSCQQINCTRDTHGNVVEGAPDEVHRVYYYWALQQEAAGYVGEDGAPHPPRWRLREMLIRGMHHLL
jgi:mitochondrial import inner membrane translocase subunit TIM44